MDQISVQSSSSQNSSCSNVTYQGTDGYISDGEDPFFIPPPEEQGDSFQEVEQESSSFSSDDDESASQKSKTEADYQQKRIRREKKNNVKEIMDELKFGRNTTMLLNRNSLIPSYDQITRIMNQIKRMYPKRSLDKIISKLHWELVQNPKEQAITQILKARNPPLPKTIQEIQKKERWLRQREIAALAFCQLGYGITKMRKYIEQNAINIQIDIHTYEQIIKKLVLDAYHRLERFLRKKCHKIIKPIKNETEQKFLLQALKSCKNKFDTFEIHNFYKLIKMTYTDEKMRVSKRIASRMYHTCQDYIMRKKLKSGYMDPDNPQSQIYNTDKLKWDEPMIELAVDIYIKEGSLNRVKEIMTKTYGLDISILQINNIKYHIDNKVKIGIDIIKNFLQKSKKEAYSPFRDKELVNLDSTKVKWLLDQIQATNVRTILCQIYKAKEPTVILLKQAVLAINEFVLTKQNEVMIQEMRRTKRQYDPVENQFRRQRRAKRS